MENSSQHKPIKSNSHRAAILIMVLCTVFTSTGQLLWKTGFNQADLTTSFLTLINLPFLLGFISYGIGAILMLIAFKKGELSVLYPIIATSYVWVTLLSPWLFNEHISLLKWIGITIIVLSVSILGIGGSKKHAQQPSNQNKPQIPTKKSEVHQ